MKVTCCLLFLSVVEEVLTCSSVSGWALEHGKQFVCLCTKSLLPFLFPIRKVIWDWERSLGQYKTCLIRCSYHFQSLFTYPVSAGKYYNHLCYKWGNWGTEVLNNWVKETQWTGQSVCSFLFPFPANFRFKEESKLRSATLPALQTLWGPSYLILCCIQST